MKKLLFILTIGFCQLTVLNCFAQAPNAIPYQGVARNAAGNIIASQPVSLRVSIHDGTAGGTVVYKETHSATTTALGLFNVNIGSGTIITGTLTDVNWGSGAKFLQVEMDAAGGVAFTDMGTTQLSSVPYALYAGSSAGNKWTVSGTDIYNNNTGNVGIGTTNPLYKLHVANSGGRGIVHSAQGVEVGTYIDASGGWIGTNTNHPLHFYTNDGYQQISLLQNGKVGIGTTTPASKLDVEGGVSIGATYSGTTTAPTNGAIIEGNVGIGTSNPTAKLHVQASGTNNAILRIENSGTTNEARIEFSKFNGLDSASVGYYPGSALLHLRTFESNSDIVFEPNKTEIMRIKGSGNVGIGTTTPIDGKLVLGNEGTAVVNTVFALTNTSSGFTNSAQIGLKNFNSSYRSMQYWNQNSSASATTKAFNYLNNSATEILTMLHGGNIGIGTTSPANKLDVEGGLAIGATYSGTSAAPINGAIIEGSVGIGTTTPAKKLDVAGDALINGVTIGRGAGNNQYNTAVGNSALNVNTSGSANTTVGINGLVANTTGSFNTALGLAAMQGNLGGNNNTAVGYNGLISNISGSNNTALGYGADVSASNLTNATAIGYNATVSASNSLVLGNNANVGIGTSSPQTPLHIVSSATNGHILFNGANVDCKIGTDGVHDMWLDNTTLTAVASKSISFKITGVTRMKILGTGNVGIGQTSPQAPLHVSGTGITTPFQARTYFALNTSLNSDNSTSGNILIRADGWFWANGGGYIATSDKRIKSIIGATNTQQDLETLASIKITDYKYIDEIRNGSRLQKKVIAQQLKEVYPDAVNQNAGVIPNVYETAQAVKIIGATTIISTRKKHDFKTGDIVKLVLEKGAEKELKVTVMDEHTFKIDEAIDDNVFVYGKKVDDLLNVDYDAVSMLNVAATQELYKLIKELQEENRSLKKQNTEMKTVNEKLETRVSAIEKKINSLPVASQVAN